MDVHPDLQAERAYVAHAYECLDAMRRHTEKLLEQSTASNQVEEEILRFLFQERLATMGKSAAPLTFGRVDQDDHETHYIGRRHVHDDSGDPVVVDWRARVAAPFYRATIHDAMGLDRRRRFVLDGTELVDLFDEDLSDPDSMVAQGHGGVPDPLLAELGRARTGQMRDIVATIQAEQDEIIRAGLDRFIVVQGGPGTGKTAVGLHRAAFLLYEHRDILERQKVLIVGPNRLFLEYISDVLPSLGEAAAYQTTIDGLVGALARARTKDPDDVARLKGDVRMADVIYRAAWERLKQPDADLKAVVGGILVKIPASVAKRLMRAASESAPSYAEGRRRFFDSVGRHVHDELSHEIYTSSVDPDAFIDTVLKKSDVGRALAKAWPSVGPGALVKGIVSSKATLARAADGLFSDAEQASIRARTARSLKEEGWSLSDLALLDEADAVLNGIDRRFGHAIVDEAQDLSAMELRMVERRTRVRSMTILGDLAQATSPAGQEDWDRVAAYLGSPEGAEVLELSLGYRVPAALLDFANRLLPLAAPGVAPSRSVRTTGEGARFVRSAPGFLMQDVEDELRSITKLWQTVGLIVPESLVDEVAASLDQSEIRYGSYLSDDLDQPVTLLTAVSSKGLEFDAVVVVEPGAIIDEAQGAGRLYVALTRAVQHLSVVHEGEMPAVLEGATAPSGPR